YNIFVSTGSACSARHGGYSNYVLPAIGLKDSQVQGAIRLSFSYMNTVEEVDYTIEALKKILPMLRRIKK
ncbi:cysteine desulfurase NifS, partial [Listeria monocytogenes]|nr:cysteine desulfurase NifS [Listeria monocytogenes]